MENETVVLIYSKLLWSKSGEVSMCTKSGQPNLGRLRSIKTLYVVPFLHRPKLKSDLSLIYLEWKERKSLLDTLFFVYIDS